jgi:hypothetical protein
VRTVVEVESEILETDEPEEDKQLDIRLQPIYETLNLSTQETASFREWWRFSYLFDIGEYLYLYLILYYTWLRTAYHIWITCWVFFKSSFWPQNYLFILIFGCGKCAEMFFSILFLMANLFLFFVANCECRISWDFCHTEFCFVNSTSLARVSVSIFR